MKMIKNMKFRTKVILLCVWVLLMNGILTGSLYYNYAFKDTLQNYYGTSEDMVSQMEGHLHDKIKSITQRVHAMFYNNIFLQSMRTYLINGQGEGYTKLLGETADTITGLHQGDRLIHSVVVQTSDTLFENFTRIRRHEFRFEESDMYQYWFGCQNLNPISILF